MSELGLVAAVACMGRMVWLVPAYGHVKAMLKIFEAMCGRLRVCHGLCDSVRETSAWYALIYIVRVTKTDGDFTRVFSEL